MSILTNKAPFSPFRLLASEPAPSSDSPAAPEPAPDSNTPVADSAAASCQTAATPQQCSQTKISTKDEMFKLMSSWSGFTTDDQHSYLRVHRDDRIKLYSIHDPALEDALIREYMDTTNEVPSIQPIRDAIRAKSAWAKLTPGRVWLRVGEHQGNVFYDLANDQGEVVEVSLGGWQLTTVPPINFVTAAGAMPLPHPAQKGDLRVLFDIFSNLSRKQAILVIAWLFGAMRPTGPYPLLALHGSKGSGKSMLTKTLRAILDPAASPMVALHKSPRDFWAHAKVNRLICYDNISALSQEMSDALCQVCTDGSFAMRELYTTSTNHIVRATRPVILNGITTGLASKSDLADRAILINLPSIASRISNKKLERQLARALPGILGGLYYAVAGALSRIGSVEVDGDLRMVDFAEWVLAGEKDLPWGAGEFMAAYQENIEELKVAAVDEDAVATAVEELLEGRDVWSGTPTECLEALSQQASVTAGVKISESWPKAPNKLSERLRRAQADLEAAGITMELDIKINSKRVYKFKKKAQPATANNDQAASPQEEELASWDDDDRGGTYVDII